YRGENGEDAGHDDAHSDLRRDGHPVRGARFPNVFLSRRPMSNPGSIILVLYRATKRSRKRNRIIVRPLWPARPANGCPIEKDFSLWAPPGAIIEHEDDGPRVAARRPKPPGPAGDLPGGNRPAARS